MSATGGFPSAPVEQVKKNRANPPNIEKRFSSSPFIVPLAWIELWLITLFHVQGCALKIAVPPLGGSRGTMVGNRQPKSRGEGGLPPSSSASPIPSPLGSGEPTLLGIWRIDPFHGPPGVGLTLMFPDSESSRLCSRSVSPLVSPATHRAVWARTQTRKEMHRGGSQC